MGPFAPYHTADIGEVKFDMEPYISEYKNGIDISWNYKRGMFKPGTIGYMVKEYIKLLDFFSKNPGKSFKAFKLSKGKRAVWEK
jgi:hypothetical protein